MYIGSFIYEVRKKVRNRCLLSPQPHLFIFGLIYAPLHRSGCQCQCLVFDEFPPRKNDALKFSIKTWKSMHFANSFFFANFLALFFAVLLCIIKLTAKGTYIIWAYVYERISCLQCFHYKTSNQLHRNFLEGNSASVKDQKRQENFAYGRKKDICFFLLWEYTYIHIYNRILYL